MCGLITKLGLMLNYSKVVFHQFSYTCTCYATA
jgi:hypothetical protein